MTICLDSQPAPIPGNPAVRSPVSPLSLLWSAWRGQKRDSSGDGKAPPPRAAEQYDALLVMEKQTLF